MEYFSIAIVGIMTCFAIAGIIDKLFLKNKLCLGPEFTRGIEMIGPLCLAVVGIIALVPEIAWVIENTITPIYQMMGLDPSMAVTAVLAIDMGGFQLAKAVALDTKIATWAGIVYGSMMGATIVFSIPVGLAAIKKKDVAAFSKGILFGIAAIPVGTFVGGLILGVPVLVALKNLIIPIIFSAIIILCLIFFPNGTTKIFKWFSIFINIVGMLGLALAMVKDLVLAPLANQNLFDINKVPFFNILGSTSEGILVAGSVGLVLSGALPFVYCLQKWLDKPLKKLANKTGMSSAGITGFLLSMANNMAMFATFDKMKEKEQILNVSFAVCAAFIIGDHLAFTAANAPEAIAAMMVAKIVSALLAVAIALVFIKLKKRPNEKIEIVEESK